VLPPLQNAEIVLGNIGRRNVRFVIYFQLLLVVSTYICIFALRELEREMMVEVKPTALQRTIADGLERAASALFLSTWVPTVFLIIQFWRYRRAAGLLLIPAIMTIIMLIGEFVAILPFVSG